MPDNPILDHEQDALLPRRQTRGIQLLEQGKLVEGGHRPNNKGPHPRARNDPPNNTLNIEQHMSFDPNNTNDRPASTHDLRHGSACASSCVLGWAHGPVGRQHRSFGSGAAAPVDELQTMRDLPAGWPQTER